MAPRIKRTVPTEGGIVSSTLDEKFPIFLNCYFYVTARQNRDSNPVVNSRFIFHFPSALHVVETSSGRERSQGW